jgi:hypothetical protein
MGNHSTKAIKMSFDKVSFCKNEYKIKGDLFMRNGVTYRVNWIMTYNVNINNNGTPYVIGNNFKQLTDHIKLKTFLVDNWIQDNKLNCDKI